jgi:hypothetical protein
VFARIVRDTDNSGYDVDSTDLVTDVELEAGLADVVTTYGQGGETPVAGAAVPEDDEAGTAVAATLADLDQGTTFPEEDDSALRGVAFTPQGMAVAIDDAPATPIHGAFYVTDNNTAVFAVVLAPLGTVGIRSLNPENQQWN